MERFRVVRVEQEGQEFVIELPKEYVENWGGQKLKIVSVGPFLVIGPEDEVEKYQFNVIEREK
ncbi:MAG: hypothetical protein QW607_10810 [Desulfurococcaceae archaeon]